MSEYPQQQPPPYAYGAAPYGYGPREHPKGTTILVLGILSIVLFSPLGPFAWSMGNKALAEIDANPYAYSNRGSVSAGRICGIVGTILLIVTVAIFAIAIIIAIFSVAATTSRG